MSLIFGTRGIGDWSSPDERPKSYHDTIFKLVPDLAAFFNLTSKLGEEQVADMEYRVFEEGLAGAALKVSGAPTDVATAITLSTTLEAEPAKAVRAGTFLRNTRTNEILRVASDPVTPWTGITVDARGSWAEVADNLAMADGDTLEILGTTASEGSSALTPISDTLAGGWNFLEDLEETFEITDWSDDMEVRPGNEKNYAREKRRGMERFKRAMEKDLFWGKKKLGTVAGKKLYRTAGLNSLITSNRFDDSGTGTTIDRVFEVMQTMRSFGQGSDTKWGLCGSGAMTRLALLIQKNTTMNMSISDPLDRRGTYGLTVRELEGPTLRIQLIHCSTLSETSDTTNTVFLVDPKYLKRAVKKGRIGAVKVEDDIKKDDGYRGHKGRWRAVMGLMLGQQKVHGWWNVGAPTVV